MDEHTIIIPNKLICVVLAIVLGILFGCIKACCNAHEDDDDDDDQDPETGLAGVRYVRRDASGRVVETLEVVEK